MKKTYGNNLIIAFFLGVVLLAITIFGISEGFRFLIQKQNGLGAVGCFIGTLVGVVLCIILCEKWLENYYDFYIVKCTECNAEFDEHKAQKTTVFKFGQIVTDYKCPNCKSVL